MVAVLLSRIHRILLAVIVVPAIQSTSTSSVSLETTRHEEYTLEQVDDHDTK